MFSLLVFFASIAPSVLGQDLEARPDARWYEGERLEAVAMPVGGIGTGTVWISGDGRLCTWQVFNNYDEKPLPDTFLALRVGGETGQLRVLQRGDVWGKRGFQDVRCLGEYPFLKVFFRDESLPAQVSLEAFNPLIPTATKDSSIPCAIFAVTVRNRGQAPLEASLLFSLLNPVGYAGGAQLSGPRWSGFGSNRNRFEPVPGGGEVHLGIDGESWPRLGRPVSLAVWGRGERCVLHARGVRSVAIAQGAPRAEAVWLEGLSGGEEEAVWRALGAIAQDGGAALISGARQSFFERVRALGRGEASTVAHEVFEDFEKGTYEGWTVEGEAFGKAPHVGTTPGQQPVSGFRGSRLVNTYLPNDGPQGRLLSRPFKIAKRYIGFLVGGGSHEGRTCVNLLVDGKVVRTRTGRDVELLEPASWDVADLVGREAQIEIVDRESGGWGHVNADHIVFSDEDPRLILAPVKGLGDLVKLAGVRILRAETVPCGAQIPSPFAGIGEGWSPDEAIALAVEGGERFRVLLETSGVPLVLSGPFGKGRLILVTAKGLPASWGMSYLAQALGTTYEHGDGIDPESAIYGELSLAALGDETTVKARWRDPRELWEDFGDDGRLSGPADSGASPTGETYAAALSVSMRLEAGASKSARFILAWHFPNVERFGHRGNKYSDWFANARQVCAYVRENLGRLEADTRLFHDTVYASNLPYFVLDAVTSQLAVLRGPTSWWAREHKDTKKDYFAAYEGSYGCCPLNCTHVWNYAQSHARLFPEIGRNLRWYDFQHYMNKETGETQHRQHSPHGAFVDGQAAVIEAAYREHLMSPDGAFLREVYPSVKKAMEWLIRKIDPDEDGVNGGEQWNTYDVATNGAHTFIGSQYLSALAAAEQMALRIPDEPSAARWRKIREAGSRNQTEKLWNGQYFIQIPDPAPARDYNTGCHSDQLLGQWWAHMLDTGYLYPPDRVRSALRSIFRHNFRQNFRGFRQAPRRYVLDDEAGLLLCSWPQGGRPNPFILYADEIWTGIEYSTAGLMIYEGLIDEALAIVKAARDRYDGRIRHGLNSGPGGNPFNELECGKFYARAMSSWGLLLASQGFVYDGPAGTLGFRPRWKPEEHASFFSAAEGWGFFRQSQGGSLQRSEIECRWGSIRVRELVLAAPVGWREPSVRRDSEQLAAEVVPSEGSDVRLRIPETRLRAGERLVVEIPIE